MKTINFIPFAFALLSILGCQAQDSAEKEIKQTVKSFAKAADDSDADKLSTYLDANYRLVMNQLMGSDKVVILDRETYLGKIRAKEFGGDKRELTFKEIIVNGKSASVLVELKGSKMTFISILTLVQDKDGNWKLVSDVPMITK